MSDHMESHFRPAGLSGQDAEELRQLLQERLYGLLDLTLVIKHAHWNVVGVGFIAVHEMLDEHLVAIRKMVDEVAERIATLGFVPNGLAGGLVESRDWDDYALGRASVDGVLVSAGEDTEESAAAAAAASRS